MHLAVSENTVFVSSLCVKINFEMLYWQSNFGFYSEEKLYPLTYLFPIVAIMKLRFLLIKNYFPFQRKNRSKMKEELKQ